MILPKRTPRDITRQLNTSGPQADVIGQLIRNLEAAPKPQRRGLFGGRPNIQAQAFPAERGYGIADRIGDFAAIYNGNPTRRDQLDARRQADAFGSTFGDLLGDNSPQVRDQNQAAMQRLIAMRAARGEDVSAFTSQADAYRDTGYRNDLAGSVPSSLRSAALAAPNLAGAYAFDQASNDIYPGVDGGYVRGAKGGGQFESAYDAPLPTPTGFMPDPQNPNGLAPRPGGPQDPAFRYQTEFQGTAGRVAATPPDPVDPLGESQIVAMVMQKAMSGQPLNPQEQAIFDRQTALPQNPMAGMFGLGGGVPGAAPGAASVYPQAGAPQGSDPLAGVAEGQTVYQDGVAYVRRNGQMVRAN